MSELRIISQEDHQLRPLIDAALKNELRLIEFGIRQTKNKLKNFENNYQIDTQEFLKKYEDDQFEETMDLIEWIGEYRMLERLNQEANVLRGIKLEN